MPIPNAGSLVDHIQAAVLEHGATPFTEIRVRVGSLGLDYKVAKLQGCKDQRGFLLILETEVIPDNG